MSGQQPALLEFNGRNANIEVDERTIDCRITETHSGKWTFFHVCCDCRGAHEVQAWIEDGALCMRWTGRDRGPGNLAGMAGRYLDRKYGT